jgi:CRISPR-associated protein Csm2
MAGQKFSFYIDGDRARGVDPRLFSEYAKKQADSLNEKGKNAPTQVRKFFDEVVDLESKILQGVDWQTIYPFVNLLKARAAYSYARSHVSQPFVDFIVICSNAVETADDLKVFSLYFESVYAFLQYNAKGGRA